MAARLRAELGEDDQGRALLVHAFDLLASLELGQRSDWHGPASAQALRSRVETLALLFNLVPRPEGANLDKVLAAWQREFPAGQPADAAAMRASARRALGIVEDAESAYSERQEQFTRAAALTRLRNSPAAPPSPLTPAAEWTDAQAQSQCAYGIGVWLELLKKPEWTQLPAVIPGDSPVELEQVYVELYAVPVDDRSNDAGGELTKRQRMPRQKMATQYPAVSAGTMVARTLERCIAVGEPGSGKSTLMQWLACAANRRRLTDFDGALLVKLSAYAAELDERPQLSLLEFFFESLDTKLTDWRSAASWMRRVAAANRRFLLLLDGWDEVPATLRERVRRRMADEEAYFVTAITSRPSGLPKQLLTGSQVDLYHIARLTERATEELVDKLLRTHGRSDLREPVLGRIKEDANFREMAGNPFLLGLLVGVLVRTRAEESAPQTLAEMYEQVSGWIRDQHNQSAGENDRLTTAHLAGLRRLSYELLFEGDRPNYVFSESELAKRLDVTSIGPVLQSRFVNRMSLLCDEHSFLHATFEEFFAAEHAATLKADEIDAFLDRAFGSASRLIVLEFLAGKRGMLSKRCQMRAVEWLRRRDRYLQTILKVARLIAAGRWQEDDPHQIGRSVRDELWKPIATTEDMELTELAVEAFAALDSIELCRRAKKQKGLSTWAVNCMATVVPATMACREGLDQLLIGEWETFAGIEVRGGATAEEIALICATLADQSLNDADRREAAIRAGAARDHGAVPTLLGILFSGTAGRDLLEQTIFSLGAIGGRDATNALIGLVLGDRPMADEFVRMAAAGLRNVEGGRKALDPSGRDRLVRRVAVVPPDAPQLKFVLAALEGFPVRDGASVFAETALQTDIDPSLRSLAVRVLATASERPLIQKVVSSIVTEPSAQVAGFLLNVAIQRSLAVPLGWLEGKIKSCRERVQLHQLVKALVLLFPNAPAKEQRQAARFLHEMIAASMTANVDAQEERAKALVQALSLAGQAERLYLSDHTLELAELAVSHFAADPKQVADGCVLLAAAVLSHFRRGTSRFSLRKALKAALDLKVDQEMTTQRVDRLATALARSLAVVAPGELLDFPVECGPVDTVLRSQAVRQGWMIFSDRITDAEGTEVATTEPSVAPLATATQSTDWQDLLKQLPEQSGRVLYSYWLMVKEGGACRPGDTLKSVYAAIRSRIGGDIDDELARDLNHLFPDELPKFSSWRRTLNRIEGRFADQPEMLTQLRCIGLCRRRPNR
jgi:NACHT domain